jgi:hypothetical protein
MENASGVTGKRTWSGCGVAVPNPNLVAGVHEGEMRRSGGNQKFSKFILFSYPPSLQVL